MTTKIVPSPGVDPQVLMALQLVRAFIPPSLRVLYVKALEQPEEDPLQHLAQYLQHSGYREATLLVAPALVEESPEDILQVLRHELVHAHLHQLDVFVKALIAACPGNRARAATTEVYEMLRESICDDISYGLGDVLKIERERQEAACLFKMADDMVERLNAVKAKEQAIW